MSELRSIKARFSLIVAHFLSEIFYCLAQRIRSLSPQKPTIIQFHDQKYVKLQNLKSNLQDCPLHVRLKMTSQNTLKEVLQVVFRP